MELFNTLLIFVTLSIIVYQDFKYRAIYWILIPILFGLLVWKGWKMIGWRLLVINFGWNMAFVVLMLFCLILYFSIKHRKLIDITNAYLGWGDILFFIPLCLFFSPLNYMVFFIASLILILISTLLYNLFVKQSITYIPLAGAMSLILMVVGLLLEVWGYSLYDDFYVLRWLIG